MSEAVKRYWLESYVDGFYKARQFVLASDHDRIVSALIAGREAAERENESLRSKAHATEQAAITMRAECDQLKSLLKEAGEELNEYDRAVIEAGTEPSVK